MPDAFYNASRHDFAKVLEAIEDVSLTRIPRRAKLQDAGSPGFSLPKMKRRRGMTVRRPQQ